MASIQLSIGQELICSICLDHFDQPKLLPCGHTFCLDCIEGYSQNTHLANTILSRFRVPTSVKCPNCNAESKLPPNGIRGFKDNLIAKNMVGVVQKMQSDSTKAETELTTNAIYCKMHKSEAIRFYCENCDIFICPSCVLEHTRKDHKLDSLENEHRRCQRRVREQISSLKVVLKKKLSRLKETEQEKQHTTDCALKIRKEIQEWTDETVKQVEAKGASLQEELRSKYKPVAAYYSSSIDQMKSSIKSLTATIGQALELSTESDENQVIYLKDIELNLREVGEKERNKTLPECPSIPKYHFHSSFKGIARLVDGNKKSSEITRNTDNNK